MDKLKEWVDKQIKEIDEDERFHYKSADVFSNAPLALIQVSLESRMQILKKVRKML